MSKQFNLTSLRISAALTITLALVFTAGCNRDPNVRKLKYLESGKRFEANGKYKEAAIQFSNALKVDKNYADAHYELAKTHLKMNSPLPAYTELMRTVELAPSNVEARMTLGNLLLAGGAPDRAKTQANAVLAINPNNADAYALLAGIAQRSGDIAETRKDLQHALELDPNRSDFHSAMAMLDARDPATSGAAEGELSKAASLDPKSVTPHLLLGELLDRKGDHQGAELQFLAAISAAPKNVQARAALASLYFRGGDKAKAEQTLRQAIDDNQDDEAASTLLVEFYARTGQIDRAEPTFADLNSKYPKSFAIKLTYARILFDKKNYAKATELANQLTKVDAGNVEVQTLNALLLVNAGKTDEALTLLKKAAKDNPNNPQTQLLLARVAASKGDLATSETSLRTAAKLSPGSIEAASGLASIAIQRNDVGMLTQIADRTIQMHPDYPDAYYWRASTEVTRKEFDKAEADLQTVLKKNPDSAAAYMELGQIRLAQGHVPEGQALLQKTLDKDPNSSRAMALLIAYDLQAKQPAKAIARVQAQIAKVPGNGDYYSQLARLQLLETKDIKGAVDSSQKAMQLSPASFDAVQVYTQAQVAAGNVDPAISVWKNWINSHPTDARATQMLGVLDETKGDQTKAIEDYKKTLQLDPNNPVAANNLAYLMVENGQNVDVALSLAQTARRIWPNSAQTADTLAWVYYYKGNYGAARDLLESALKTTPNDAAMHFHLGMTYSKLNNRADAQLHLKKAASIAPDTKTGKDATAELAKLS